MQNPIKILFFSDTHLGFDYPVNPKIQRRRRGDDFFNNFEQVLDIAHKENFDLVIHGGDLFFRSKIPPMIVDKVYLELLKFSKHGIPIVIVPGNHERSILPESILLATPEINIFQEPNRFTFRIKDRTISVSGFPFVRGDIRATFTDIVTELTNVKRSDIELLVVHHPFDGAQVGPQEFTFFKREDTIALSPLLTYYDMILAGHIHRRQVLKLKDTPIVFSGSIERTSIAEIGEQKGFVEIVIDDTVAFKFRDLYARPMYVLDIPNVDNLESEVVKAISTLEKDSIVYIKFTDKSYLSDSHLRELAPDTMNIQSTGYRKRRS